MIDTDGRIGSEARRRCEAAVVGSPVGAATAPSTATKNARERCRCEDALGGSLSPSSESSNASASSSSILASAAWASAPASGEGSVAATEGAEGSAADAEGAEGGAGTLLANRPPTPRGRAMASKTDAPKPRSSGAGRAARDETGAAGGGARRGVSWKTVRDGL